MNVEKFHTYLARLLAIRKEDLRRTLLMQAYLFLIISVLLLLKPVSNALFLSTFGVENLPYVFIAIAVIAFFFTRYYQKFQKKLPFIKLHKIILILSVVLFTGFSIEMFIPSSSKVFIIAFYIWVAIYALVTTSQFWILANVIFNPREARRVFGIIGAGGIAGGVFGGYMASLLVGLIGNEGLVLLSAVLMGLCFPIVNKLWNEHKLVQESDSLILKKRIKVKQKFSFRRLSKSRHLILLSMVTGLAVIVSKLVDFQFQGIATSYHKDPEALTSFFGFWFSTFNVIGLVIQLFLTNRVLKVFGVSKAQFILPSTFIITGLLLVFFPVLWAVILLKGADGSFKQSIQRSVNELLIVPIPRGMKDQSKTFIDVFVDSAATGISGIILLILIHSSNIATQYISIAIVLLSLAWLALSYLMKKEYFISFKNQFLKKTSTSPDRIHPKFTFFQNINTLLEDKNDEDLIALLDNLDAFPNNFTFDKTILLLKHNNPEVRLKTLVLRPKISRSNLSKLIDPLTKDPKLNVRVEAFIFLLEEKEDYSEVHINGILDEFDKNYDIALLCACCIYFRDNNGMKIRLHLRDRLLAWIKEGKITKEFLHYKDIKFHLLKSICYGRFVSLYKYIDMQLMSKDRVEKLMAINSCAYTLNRKYAERLIQLLKDEDYQSYASSALLFYDESLLEIGDKIMSSELYRSNTKVKYCHIISQIGSQNAVNFLSEHLNHKKFKVRKNIVFQLNAMKAANPELDYKTDKILLRIQKEVKDIRKLLTNHYTVKYQLNIELKLESDKFMKARKGVLKRIHLIIRKKLISIFLLLGLEYNKAEILDIYNGLVSNDKLKKVYAIEFLEMTIDYKYNKHISSIVELSFNKKISEADLKAAKIKRVSNMRAITSLYKYPDQVLKSRMIGLIDTINKKKYFHILQQDIGFLNPMLRKRVINKLRSIFGKKNAAG